MGGEIPAIVEAMRAVTKRQNWMIFIVKEISKEIDLENGEMREKTMRDENSSD